jgi:small-conductance mechanosensitive channel
MHIIKQLASIIILFVFTSFHQLAGQDLRVNDSTGNINAPTSRYVDLYISMNQRLDRDKERLDELQRDSIWIEPLYQKASLEFDKLNQQIDSLSKLNTEDSLLQQRQSLTRNIFEFLLERRKTIHQILFLMNLKLPIESEIVNFFLKDEDAALFEIVLQDKGIEDIFVADSLSELKNVGRAAYDLRIDQEERVLMELRARLNYAQHSYKLLSQLVTLHQQDTTILGNSSKLIPPRLSQWNNIQQGFDQKLEFIEEEDSYQEYLDFIQSISEEMLIYMKYMVKTYQEDSINYQDLNERLKSLAHGQAVFSDRIVKAQEEMETQMRWLSYLRNPFSHISLYHFFVERGIRVLLTLFAILIIWLIGRWSIPKILQGVVRKSFVGNRTERIETLSRTLRSGFSLFMIIAGVLIFLSELGINISVLLGGAAVLSLAIAFGAQSLVKDYFTGFIILTENQYRIGNVVKINDTAGLVEDMSMRMTILRDLEGIAHFVPHGEIKSVSNLTHSWSRALLEISVAYKENVDRVMEVIMKVANELRMDPEFKDRITQDPEMLGVDSLSDSGVTIKFLIQTQPLAQWAVKREYLRRIKNRFDELGIEIPLPHRKIYFGDQQYQGKED